MMARARRRARTYEPGLATTAVMSLLVAGTASRISTAADGAAGAPRDTSAASSQRARRLVVVVHARGAQAVVERAQVRLVAELRTAGFDVEERTVDSDDQARASDEPSENGPVATVVLRRPGERIEANVSVFDRSTHKTSFRQIESRPGEGSDRNLALGVVELLRASLGEPPPPSRETEPPASSTASAVPPSPPSAPVPAPLPAPVPPPAAAPASASEVPSQAPEALPDGTSAEGGVVKRGDVHASFRPRSGEADGTSAEGGVVKRGDVPSPELPRVGVRLGMAGIYTGPDIGPALAPEVLVLWHASSIVGIGVFGAATVSGGAISTHQEGAAKVSTQIALIDVSAELPTAGALRAVLSGGLGAYHLLASATGETARGFVGGDDDVWVGLAAAGAGMRWRITPLVSIVIDVRELLTLPRPVVRFGTEAVAEAMHPGTLAGVSAAMDW